MNRWIARTLLAALMLTVGIWGWRTIFPNPERVIRKQFTQVARLASFAPDEAPLAKLANTQKLAGYFAPDVEIQLDLPGRSEHRLSGRPEVVQAAMAARNQLSSLRVEFPDLIVTVDPEKQSAVVNLTATARVSGERDLFVQEMEFQVRKLSGDWLITRVETVKTLR